MFHNELLFSKKKKNYCGTKAIILWKKVSLHQHVLEILPEMLCTVYKGTNFVSPCQENTSVYSLGASHFLESKIKDIIHIHTHINTKKIRRSL